MYILLAILIFSVLIAVHELGHFLAAKACGVQVNEFSIFMGPVIWQKQGKETLYSIRCVPIGGFCAMEGEDEESDNPRAFTAASPWKRILILVSGAAMNFLLGLLIILCIYLPSKYYTVPVISGFFEGCPYEAEYGFQEGDRILSIDGRHVGLAEDVSLLLGRNSTGVYDITLRRGGEKIRLEDFPLSLTEYETENGTEKKYGLYFGAAEATLGMHLRHTWNEGIYFTRLVWMSLGDLLHGSVGLKDMSGPVGIVAVINEAGNSSEDTAAGIANVFYLGAFIAVNLAIMNMLPIPALDGGRVFLLLVTALIEAVIRKKIDPKYEGYIHAAGMVLLLGLMAFIMFQDIVKLFR